MKKNFRIYYWPYYKFEINIKYSDKDISFKKNYNFFFNFKNNEFKPISNKIKFQQKVAKEICLKKLELGIIFIGIIYIIF